MNCTILFSQLLELTLAKFVVIHSLKQ